MSGENLHYDEGFTRTENGQTVSHRFMLARPGTLSNVSSSPFAPKSVLGDRSYGDYDAISAFAMTDFSGGMGQERASDTTCYYDCSNIDARGGKLVLGPAVTHTCLPSGNFGSVKWIAIGSATYTKRAMEIEVLTPRYFERVWLPMKADKGVGTVTVKLFAAEDDLPVTELQSVTVSPASLSANGQWIPINFGLQTLGIGTYWFVIEQTSATPVYIVACESDFAEHSYCWNGSIWFIEGEEGEGEYALLYADPKVMPDSPPILFTGSGADQVPRVWATAGKAVYYMNATGAPAPVAVSAGDRSAKLQAADIVGHGWFRAPADTSSWLYLALGDAADMVRCDVKIGDEHWQTVSIDGSNRRASCLTVHENVLICAYDRNKVEATNGTKWGQSATSAAEVGDRTYSITNLISWNGSVWCGKPDGLYKLTMSVGYPTTGTISATKIIDFSALAYDTNFSMMVVHQGDLYFSAEAPLP